MKNNPIRNQVKSNIAKSGMTLTEVVEQMNINRPPKKQTTIQNISNKIARGTIKYSEILEIASILNMTITWSDINKEDISNV